MTNMMGVSHTRVSQGCSDDRPVQVEGSGMLHSYLAFGIVMAHVSQTPLPAKTTPCADVSPIHVQHVLRKSTSWLVSINPYVRVTDNLLAATQEITELPCRDNMPQI